MIPLYEQIRTLLRNSNAVTTLLVAGAGGILPSSDGSTIVEPGEGSLTPFILVGRPQEIPLGYMGWPTRIVTWDVSIYYQLGEVVDDLIAGVEATMLANEGRGLTPDRLRVYDQIMPGAYVGPLYDQGWNKNLITLTYTATCS